MAQVVKGSQLHEWIDDYLTYLKRAWEDIPALAAEWDEWDEHSKLVFDVNLGVPNDRLYQLREWAAQGLLTPAQRERYDELLRLVDRHRPTLARLLGDDAGPAPTDDGGAGG